MVQKKVVDDCQLVYHLLLVDSKTLLEVMFLSLSDSESRMYALANYNGIVFVYDILTTGSYGSTLRYKSVERIKAIGKHSLLGASGEISDFQELLRNLDELM